MFIFYLILSFIFQILFNIYVLFGLSYIIIYSLYLISFSLQWVKISNLAPQKGPRPKQPSDLQPNPTIPPTWPKLLSRLPKQLDTLLGRFQILKNFPQGSHQESLTTTIDSYN